MTNLRIVVIGAGVVGASIAWHLARRGASVHLFDQGARPASGVTGHAFGWINSINGSPETDPVRYRLLRHGVEDYRRLAELLPEVLADIRRGSLVWLDTPDETEALVRMHRTEGAAVELVDAATIAQWEPHLRERPVCAAYSPEDLALSPTVLTNAFARAAEAAGATLTFGETIMAVETDDRRATGVRTTDGSVSADVVVLAAGVGTGGLASSLGFDIGVVRSPAILARYSASAPFVHRILRGPGLEVRQGPDHSLFVAAGCRDDMDENVIALRALDRINKRFDVPGDIRLIDAVVGQRPAFANNLPRLGFLAGIEGAYVATGHPGIILAPLMGRLAAEEIIDGRGSILIAPPATAESRS